MKLNVHENGVETAERRGHAARRSGRPLSPVSTAAAADPPEGAPRFTEPEPLPTDLAALSAEALHLLEVAAVFGRTFSVESLAEVLGEPIGKVLETLREALAAEVLIPYASLLLFRDKTSQRAIYSRVPDPIRHALHHRIGMTLLQQGGSAVPAAAHLIVAARPDDQAALAALDQACRELTVSAPQAAADLALRALHLTDAAGDEWFARSGAAVDALVRANRAREAAQLACATLTRPGIPVAWAGRLRVALSAMLLARGQAVQAVAEAEAVLAENRLPDQIGDAAASARLLALIVLDDATRIQHAAEAILAGDERPGGNPTLAMASLALAWVAWDHGRIAGALGLVRAAVHRSDRSDVGHAFGLYPRLSLATMLTTLGEFDEADAVLAQATEEIELGADALYGAAPSLFRARVHLAAGRLDEAAASARAALELAEDADTALFAPLAIVTLARIAVLRGDLAAAAEHVDRCDREPTPLHPRLGGLARTWTAAVMASAQDGPAAARQALAELYAALPTHPVLLLEEPDTAAWLTRLALATGDREGARGVVTYAEQLVRSSPGIRAARAAAAHARGLFDGDPELLRRAETEYLHPLAAASAAEDAGVAFTRDQDNAAAHEALGRALAAYERVGAVADTDRVRARLRALGVRPSHWTRAERPLTGWASLTDTEVRVARIVAEGATNAQAAGRLFLSRHTVDFHLRQIFRKLSIRSRVELTRIALQHEGATAEVG
jgi:DNA-binding CsgD family transcriptional regulator/predicted negative regulator of RcsB-dependent stress response